MYLIKHDIEKYGSATVGMFSEATGISVASLIDGGMLDRPAMLARLTPEQRELYPHAVDFFVTLLLAFKAQTFLFDSKQVLEFLRSVDRRLPPGNYAAPFNEMIVQFTQPIPETEFLSPEPSNALTEDDAILGLVIGFPGDDEGTMVNVTAYYQSTAINRTVLHLAGDGSITRDTTLGASTPQEAKDKQRIANLGMLCLAYLNSPGIELEKVETPEKVNRKRAREGKRVLDDYYICRLAKGRRTAAEGEPTGKHVSFRFDVAGHFRRGPDGRVIWIRSHQRGLANELYRPKVYRVD